MGDGAARIERREYKGPSDLRAMQDLCQRLWTFHSRWHVGDLAWDRFQHVGREAEWPTLLWEDQGTAIGWAWARRCGELYLCVDPRYPRIAAQALEWFDSVELDVAVDEAAGADESGAVRSVTILEGETVLADALSEQGYACPQLCDPAVDPDYRHMRRPVHDVSVPELPAGFTACPMSDGIALAERVAVHRAAFHPSRVSEESYRAVAAAWPYDPALDWVILTPDGRAAAYCLIWYDAEHGVGELEPVGTHPDFRRLGLAGAVCRYAMRALYEAGGHTAIVYPPGRKNYPLPARLYASIGFRDYARTLTFTKHSP